MPRVPRAKPEALFRAQRLPFAPTPTSNFGEALASFGTALVAADEERRKQREAIEVARLKAQMDLDFATAEGIIAKDPNIDAHRSLAADTLSTVSKNLENKRKLLSAEAAADLETYLLKRSGQFSLGVIGTQDKLNQLKNEALLDASVSDFSKVAAMASTPQDRADIEQTVKTALGTAITNGTIPQHEGIKRWRKFLDKADEHAVENLLTQGDASAAAVLDKLLPKNTPNLNSDKRFELKAQANVLSRRNSAEAKTKREEVREFFLSRLSNQIFTEKSSDQDVWSTALNLTSRGVLDPSRDLDQVKAWLNWRRSDPVIGDVNGAAFLVRVYSEELTPKRVSEFRRELKNTDLDLAAKEKIGRELFRLEESLDNRQELEAQRAINQVFQQIARQYAGSVKEFRRSKIERRVAELIQNYGYRNDPQAAFQRAQEEEAQRTPQIGKPGDAQGKSQQYKDTLKQGYGSTSRPPQGTRFESPGLGTVELAPGLSAEEQKQIQERLKR